MILWGAAVALIPVPAALFLYQHRRWPQPSSSRAYRALTLGMVVSVVAFMVLFGLALGARGG